MRRLVLSGRVGLPMAALAPLLLSLVLVPFRADLANTNVALLLVVSVVAVAATGHRLAGAIAAVSAAVWFDFFFTLPYERLTIDDRSDLVTAVLLLAVGLVVSQLATRARHFEVVAVTDAGYLALIHETAVLARAANSAPAVVDHVRDRLVELLGLRGARFEYGSLLGRPARLEADGSVVAAGTRWDVERLGLPDEEIELRVFGNGRYVGRFMLRPTPGRSVSREALLVAGTLAGQAGAAMEALRRPAKAA